MKKSFKVVLSLVPIAASSIGTAVYFSSDNSILSLNQIDDRQKNIKANTFAPSLVSSEKSNKDISETLILQNLENDKKSNKNFKDSDLNIEKKEQKLDQKDSQSATSIQIRPNTPIKTPLTSLAILKPKPTPRNIIILPKSAISLPKTEIKEEKIQQLPLKTSVLIPKDTNPRVETPAKKATNFAPIEPKVEQNNSKVKVPVFPATLDSKQEKKAGNSPIAPLIIKPETEKNDEIQEKLPLISTQNTNQNLPEEQIIQPENQKVEEIPPIQTQKIVQEPESTQKTEIKQQESPKPETKIQENTQNSNSSSQNSSNVKVLTDVEIVDQMVTSMVKDPDLNNNYAYKLLEKYKFTKRTQMALFLEKLPKVKTNQAVANLITFWTQSYASFYPNEATVPSVRQMWRNEIIKKLQLKTTGNNQNISVITQTGGRFR
ncbi:hypothetical protein R7V41_02095 [Mesomycoplasma ovipneumoniae]|uniref:Uncharacterized protein n=1 Tax=Mesomycoplasma ovipneumoniae TaxID=29562 RepID=A0AAJ2P9K3_9BACT|nr:hypothetical protein [Mesomycoplasma ovipneumoniae]MDW2906405.1 hypothetical protein [Mesomycoplasma ovipneumoniae]MDW2914305.1 hypothetical protein [Mesomycoplasma ovipneumoniae]